MNSAKRLILAGLCTVALAVPASAQADFGLVPAQTKVSVLNSNGTVDEQASSHPGSFTVQFEMKTDAQGNIEGGKLRDVLVDPVPGLIGNPNAVPTCPRQSFEGSSPQCPTATQVGVLEAALASFGRITAPIYNLTPPPGVPAQFGFSLAGRNVLQYASVMSEAGYGLRVAAVDIPVDVKAAVETIWGVPADAANDAQRFCRNSSGNLVPPCSTTAPVRAYLTLPAACEPMKTSIGVDSLLAPGNFLTETVESTDAAGNATSLTGCDSVPFAPEISSQPTSRLATSPSGLDFDLKLPDQGLEAPGGISETEPRKVVVALPDGLSINPSLAEGVGTCSPAQFEAEQLESNPGEGCPEASKLGSAVAQTPLLDEAIEGTLYLAAPYDNEFDTLGAIYMVLRGPERGILVKQAGKIEFDGRTGQITTTFEGLPPIPFSSFKLSFREGARAPLATPQACGQYLTRAKLTPFSARSDSEAVERTASFQVERGSDGGACPSGGTPPFHPTLTAGSINPAAGAYSPFNVRLSRTDAEQEITHFSIKLPPGVTGKLAGIPFCPDESIAAAKAREGTRHGGQEELEHPSCPQASEVGHTLVGAGVGQVLTYVPGKVYLAGPYQGSNLSIVAITAAKAGPFDLGTVVIREALKVNPDTAEVSVDAAGSDPIPHIVNGIPVHLRDIRVYVDRPEFVKNPTNCQPTSTASTVLGSGTEFASEADDRPVTVTSRFQAADCANLGFKPKLKISLKGATKRAGLPALTAVVSPRAGDANIGKAVVTLPPSEFLEQGHIGNSCTRVQFNSGVGNGADCPANSVLGHAVAITPLLSEPLEGAVYLRSNGGERKLPDLVAALHSRDIDINLVGFIDSLHPKGSNISQIRTTFASVPDQPVTRFTLRLFGGKKKGLLVNSTNLCKGTHRAISEFGGQNGKVYDTEPAVKAKCRKNHKTAKKGQHKKAKGKGDARLAMAFRDRLAW